MPPYLRRALEGAVAVTLTGVVLAGGSFRGGNLSVVELLDSYRTGKFAAVVAELEGDVDFKDLLKQLKDAGPEWIEAGGAAERETRELVAATFALEAARADEWREWKMIWKQPQVCPPKPPPGAEPSKAGCSQPLSVLEWKPPPLLIEWACQLMRRTETPRPIERWWQLAALAVAQPEQAPGPGMSRVSTSIRTRTKSERSKKSAVPPYVTFTVFPRYGTGGLPLVENVPARLVVAEMSSTCSTQAAPRSTVKLSPGWTLVTPVGYFTLS